jgi:hypothetical protein
LHRTPNHGRDTKSSANARFRKKAADRPSSVQGGEIIDDTQRGVNRETLEFIANSMAVTVCCFADDGGRFFLQPQGDIRGVRC